MTKLHQLYDEQGQSPWLDNLTRPNLREDARSRSGFFALTGVGR